MLFGFNPELCKLLSQRPTYYEDVLSSSDRRAVVFQWGVAMSTSLGFALCLEYYGIQHQREREPASLSEMAAVVGGIISFVRRIHVLFAKGLLLACASTQFRNTKGSRKRGSSPSGVEMMAYPETSAAEAKITSENAV